MIADLRGLPRDLSRSKRRKTTEVKDLMDQILHKYRIGMATPEEAIRDSWNEIVGETNAAFCHPLRITKRNVLVVGAGNAVVRQELLFHKAMILDRIRAVPACKHIADILFRAG